MTVTRQDQRFHRDGHGQRPIYGQDYTRPPPRDEDGDPPFRDPDGCAPAWSFRRDAGLQVTVAVRSQRLSLQVLRKLPAVEKGEPVSKNPPPPKKKKTPPPPPFWGPRGLNVVNDETAQPS